MLSGVVLLVSAIPMHGMHRGVIFGQRRVRMRELRRGVVLVSIGVNVVFELPDGDLCLVVGCDHLQQLLGWNISVEHGLRVLS